MPVLRQSIDDALKALRSRPDGLSLAEARERLREFGPNVIQRVEHPSQLRLLAHEFTHFFARVLWLAAGLAGLAHWYDAGAGMDTLALAVVAVIVVNAVFSFWQQYRAEQALAALERLLPRSVRTIRDGAVHDIPSADLVPGDIVRLEAGDRVPADARMLEAFGLRLNKATITGEAVPVALDTRPSTDLDPVHASNVALAGTAVVSGRGTALVFATGGHTEFAKIAGLAQQVHGELSPLQRELTRLTHLVTAIAVALGGVFFLAAIVLGLPLAAALLFGVGIIVANVPEGLLPTVTLSLAMAAERMAARHALVRHLPSVETLGAATVICTDKTGTLTENRMRIRRLYVDGVDCEQPDGDALGRLASAYPAYFEACLLCENVTEEGDGAARALLGDPMEVALVQMGREALPDFAAPERLDEIPFDSDRRRLSTLYRRGDGRILYVKGALETLLPLCTRVLNAEGNVPLDAEGARALIARQDGLASDGLRVLALAERRLAPEETPDELEEDLTLLGLVALEDPPRPEVPDAVARCHSAGVRVIMITGDHPHTALAIARQIGLATRPDPRIITGERLRQLSDTQLQLALDEPEILFARIDADQKLRVVQALQRKGEVVAATGDGVNDAPALKAADIGVAMGKSGTEVTREAADLVLADDNFASIVHAIEAGRAVYANIRKFLTYILTSNVPELVPYIGFVMLGIPLPLTIAQILAVDLGTDLVPALALGAEAPEHDVMGRPPRRASERLLSTALLLRAYLFLGGFEALAGMATYFYVLSRGGWAWGTALSASDPLYLQATTGCLVGIVVTQVVNLFCCRSDERSAFAVPARRNPLIAVGLGVELGLTLAIVYSPLGHRLFGTAPLPVDVWLFTLPWAGLMLAAEEGRKALVRHRSA
jgi:calcium-translocating P-type ATPase